MAEERRQDDRPGIPERPSRRAYSSPRLIEYGSVAKLTRGSRSVSSDFPQSGFAKKDCL
jgi:hypothetical protein